MTLIRFLHRFNDQTSDQGRTADGRRLCLLYDPSLLAGAEQDVELVLLVAHAFTIGKGSKEPGLNRRIGR